MTTTQTAALTLTCAGSGTGADRKTLDTSGTFICGVCGKRVRGHGLNGAILARHHANREGLAERSARRRVEADAWAEATTLANQQIVVRAALSDEPYDTNVVVNDFREGIRLAAFRSTEDAKAYAQTKRTERARELMALWRSQ